MPEAGSESGSGSELLRTPLYRSHVALGGRMVPFAGWEMPVQYQGILAEAKAVRTHAGMFDVSHMGRLRFLGPTAKEDLEWLTTNDVSKLAPASGQYSLIPNDLGGTVDDIIVYREKGPKSSRGSAEYRVVVNAANHEKDLNWLSSQLSSATDVVDETRSTVMIAVQGPEAVGVISKLTDPAINVQAVPTFGTFTGVVAGVQCFAARSGYTGEDGFELITSASDGDTLWQSLLESGVVPCGLAARDTLRVEAGFPLYGHELSEVLSPISAGLKWVISPRKSFVGEEFIRIAIEEGTQRRLVGIRMDSKRLIPTGTAVYVADDVVGEVSSGVISPLADAAIALAFVDREVKLGSACNLELRGQLVPATIGDKRFYRRAAHA